MSRCKRFAALAALLVCLWLGGAAAQELSFTAVLPAHRGEAEIRSTFLTEEAGDAYWLFLPTFADLHALPIHGGVNGLVWPWGEAFESGEAVDVPARFEETEEGVYSAEMALGDQTVRLCVMQSANLRTLFFSSSDPENHGREWIENCEHHENETTGDMAIVDQNGVVDHSAKVSSWRGRGNTTWGHDKRPYQMKLEYKTDLLKTGIPQERSRTWVLLSNMVDYSLLRDRIAFDLGLELGMTETSLSEYVDLYYDGEYRGIYLLCEKVQVQTGRVEMTDYNELLESWNDAMGQYDLDALPIREGQNAYGLAYTYAEGLAEAEDPSVGGYMVEMESLYTLSDTACYFYLGDGSIMSMQNPKYVSRRMAAYISEKVEVVRRALVNHGTDPVTGTRAADVMDVDAFARIALINELGYNTDGYSVSSSFFLLPEGEDRFRPGPVWDYALTFREIKEPGSNGVTGFKPTGWLQLFYGVPEFRSAMQRILHEELYPLVTNVLLGEEHGRYLKPMREYVAHIDASMRMNQRLWTTISYPPKTPLSQQADQICGYLEGRLAWLYPAMMGWEIDTAEIVELEASTSYLMMEEGFSLKTPRWVNARMISWELEQLTEATEEAYALWQLTAVMEPLEGFAFSETTRALFNGREVSCEMHSDGTAIITAIFEDPSYRPAYAYEEDIGLVYNHDYYAEKYPDVAEECEYDPVLMAEYFYDYGMEEIHLGNAFFNPRALSKKLPELVDEYGDMWSSYYWDFIDMRYEEWLPYVTAAYAPQAIAPEEARALVEP